MDTFAIWTIGDLNYLQAVINGLAMFMNSGSGESLFKIGLILSIITLLVSDLVSPKAGVAGVPWARFLVVFVVYQFMFGQTATVVLQDTYSADTRVVDNVPYGMAVTGWAMSTIGHEITVGMEQAFSLPNMTNEGFAGPIRALIDSRNLTLNMAGLANGGDLSRTIVDYVKDCTYVGIQLDQLSANSILQNPDPMEGIKFLSDVYGTRTDIPGEGVQEPTCTEAQSHIAAYLKSDTFWGNWNNYLAAILGNDPVNYVQTGLDKFSGSVNDARTYMLAAVIRDLYEEGLIKGSLSVGDTGSATMISQARQQRNMQLVSESRLFMTVVRPIMTFGEGLFYAVGPFMCFMIAFLPFGIGILKLYIEVSLWVQLWMPIMAILNLFVSMVVQAKMSALYGTAATGMSITSMAGVTYGTSNMADWLATASLLATSTPFISAMLMYGGVVGMTSLAGRLTGGDFVNEKISAPDVVSAQPMMSMGPMREWNQQTGSVMAGASQVMPNFDLSSSMSSAVVSAHGAMQSSSLTFGHTLSDSLRHSYGATDDWQSRQGIGQKIMSDRGDASRVISNFSSKVGNALGWNDTQMQSFENSLAGTLTAGIDFGTKKLKGKEGDRSYLQEVFANALPIDINAGIRGGDTISFGSGKELNQNQQHSIDTVEGLARDTNLQANFTKSLASDITSGHAQSFMEGLTKDDSDAVRNDAQRVTQASERFDQTASMQQSAGMRQSVSLLTIGQNLAKSDVDMFNLHSAVDEYGLGKDAINYADRFAAAAGLNTSDMNQSHQAYAMGAMYALNQLAGSSKEQAADAQFTMLRFASKAVAAQTPDIGNAHENQHLQGVGNATTAGVGERIHSEEPRLRGDTRHQVEAGMSRGQAVHGSVEAAIAGGEGRVAADHAGNTAAIDKAGKDREAAIKAMQEAVKQEESTKFNNTGNPAKIQSEVVEGAAKAAIDTVEGLADEVSKSYDKLQKLRGK